MSTVTTKKHRHGNRKMFTVGGCKTSDGKHAMLSVTAQASRTRRSNVVFVIDKSGSMKSIIEYVKLIVVQTCKQLPKNTFVGLVYFSNEAEAMTSELLDVAQDVNLDKIEQMINALEVGGATNINAAFSAGYALIPNTPSPEEEENKGKAKTDALVHNTIVLLTDGEATIGILDPAKLVQCALSLRDEKPATLFAVAIGKYCDMQFLRRVTPSGCLFRVKNNVADVIRGVTEMIGEMAHVALASFKLQISCDDFVETATDIAIDRIGDGQSKHFVFAIASKKAGSAPIRLIIKQHSAVLLDHVLLLSDCVANDDIVLPQLERLRLRSLMQDQNIIELQDFATRWAETLPDLTERAHQAIHALSRTRSVLPLVQELESQDHVIDMLDDDDDNAQDDVLPPRPMFRSQLSRQTSETIHESVLQRMQSDPTMSIPRHAQRQLDIPSRGDTGNSSISSISPDPILGDINEDDDSLPPPPIPLRRY